MDDQAYETGAATLSRPTRVQHLINRINAHEQSAAWLKAEGIEISEEMAALGLSKADVRKIQATQKTLAALMGADLVPEGAKL